MYLGESFLLQQHPIYKTNPEQNVVVKLFEQRDVKNYMYQDQT